MKELGLDRVKKATFIKQQEMLGRPGVFAKIVGLSGSFEELNGALVMPTKHEESAGKYIVRTALPTSEKIVELVLDGMKLQVIDGAEVEAAMQNNPRRRGHIAAMASDAVMGEWASRGSERSERA